MSPEKPHPATLLLFWINMLNRNIQQAAPWASIYGIGCSNAW